MAAPTPPVAAFDQVTEATPSASVAVPERRRGDAFVNHVGSVVGPVIWTAGAVVSRVTTIVAVLEMFPAVSVAVKLKVFVPTLSGTVAEKAEVPAAVPEAAGSSTRDQLTLPTAMLSAAVPPIARFAPPVT